MNAEEERVEVEHVVMGDDDLTIEHDLFGQALAERPFELGEVAVEWLEIAALDVDLVAFTKDERAKAVPLRLVELPSSFGDLRGELREHRCDGRIERRHAAHSNRPNSSGH